MSRKTQDELQRELEQEEARLAHLEAERVRVRERIAELKLRLSGCADADSSAGAKTSVPEPSETGGKAGAGVAYFSLADIEPPLLIRTPLPGDRMRPFGLKGTKKLSDIFIDKKIPLRRRNKTLVITDRKRILWLVGVATDESTRIGPDTEKILKITVDPE
jgi:tRNA(Ile)-lysidine synthetase-like protein